MIKQGFLLGLVVVILLILTWFVVLGVSFASSLGKDKVCAENLPLSGTAASEETLSINRDESVLIGTKLGEVRVTYLSSCDEDRVRLGIVAPKSLNVYRREKTKQELNADNKLYEKELVFWRKELRKSDKNRRDQENLMRGAVDNMLLEGKGYRSIANKCNVNSEFVAKRQATLEKTGSFETPLFDM